MITEKLYIQFTAEIEGDLTVFIEEGDPTPDEQLAEAAVENEYPDAKHIKVYNVSRSKTGQPSGQPASATANPEG